MFSASLNRTFLSFFLVPAVFVVEDPFDELRMSQTGFVGDKVADLAGHGKI